MGQRESHRGGTEKSKDGAGMGIHEGNPREGPCGGETNKRKKDGRIDAVIRKINSPSKV